MAFVESEMDFMTFYQQNCPTISLCEVQMSVDSVIYNSCLHGFFQSFSHLLNYDNQRMFSIGKSKHMVANKKFCSCWLELYRTVFFNES